MFSRQTVSSISSSSSNFIKQQIRNKRTRAGLSPEVQRVVSQLSVLSAGRKQPRLLKLCNEDYVKHLTVTKAWSLLRRAKKQEHEEQLKKQYESIKEANEDLKSVNKALFEVANKPEFGRRFPLEIRVPTDYPTRQLWYYDYVPPAVETPEK
ncbi:hypothetical protein CANARDRAFT_203174 [[Candida] arabinofermentans NRRL YB-2248]|uniref:Large ribosomal subunit protein mL40 n=1 Tax=[Candida] arabinofermentans NRRL YB-2248 TaxID=983967 RepID=A0A1E4SVA4_9ASCO|nr:hypothetical protein CANARDRAFT_203174 [[Candida] arabinofermentans NRRL YB-2248]